mgnify:CR=1 FL=1
MARNWRDRWKDFRDAATEAYGEGRQDHTKAVYAAREMAGQDIDQPRIVETVRKLEGVRGWEKRRRWPASSVKWLEHSVLI